MRPRCAGCERGEGAAVKRTPQQDGPPRQEEVSHPLLCPDTTPSLLRDSSRLVRCVLHGPSGVKQGPSGLHDQRCLPFLPWPSAGYGLEPQTVPCSMNRHALGAWEMFKACAHREVILMKRHSFTYKTRSVCRPEPDRNSYAVLMPAMICQSAVELHLAKHHCSMHDSKP